VAMPGNLPPGSPSEGHVRLTVVVPSRQLRELERQAKADGTSITEAIQRALELGLVAWNAVRRGERVLIQGQSGDLREISLRS